MKDDKKTIKLLDTYITRFRKQGLNGILDDCNRFGNPTLNFLYTEIYSAYKNGHSILVLAGAGIFLEELTSELWVSSQVHKAQLAGKFRTWEDVMNFHETCYDRIESRKVTYVNDIRPELGKIMSGKDLESIELLRDFVRNTFVHSKRARLLKTLSDNGVIPKTIPVGKGAVSPQNVVTKDDEVEMSVTHPLVRTFGFRALAKQLAPAMVIFIYEMFRRYHKTLAPLKDDKIKFLGHNCEYD